MASTAYPPRSSSAFPAAAASAVKSAVNAPSGTFLPGTKVQVGSVRVTIEKYLSEGGFAHVYVVRVPRPNNKHELAVLKRVAVPDKEHLANMRTEVETMKKLKGHERVVMYMDSHASQLKGGGYEVFLLMEYCGGGGLIDFMNTRLQHRLTEPEILKIFGDCAEGVACMHYLKPPLLHRDLKVENVLISKDLKKGTPVYKICDFGSAASPRPAAKTPEEGRLIEEDVQKHTTMQYRSPEMIDVWRKVPIDEKSDIWALGVLLYKLCYYTTPFEDVGQMAILNATYKYPNYPSFSPRLKKFIASMLKENPRDRPNIYQVVKEACSMRGTEVPIKDIYANRTQSEARRNESLPSPELPMSVGLVKEAPKQQVQALPDIAPMRRGRPTGPTQNAASASASAKPSPSPGPARGDPFAALDSKDYVIRAGAVDELSKKFPSVEEFSIVQDKGAFSPPPRTDSKPKSDLNDRVAYALADEVFSPPPQLAKPTSTAGLTKAQTVTPIQQPKTSPIKPASVKERVREVSKDSPLVHEPTPVRPGSNSLYKSTGVGSSPPSSATQSQFLDISSRPIWKVPDTHRSSSQPRASEEAQASAKSLKPSLPPSQRPALMDMHRSKSQVSTLNAARSPTSSRPSLEGHRPSQLELGDNNLSRAKSAQSRQRPSSAYVSSNLDYLRDQEMARKRPSMEGRQHSRQASQGPGTPLEDESNIQDDIDYLRHSESIEGRPSRKSSGHKKRSSLGAIQSGAKNIFAGRFGDAFKRFENNAPEEEGPQTPQPRDEGVEPPLLSPIEGSQPTEGRNADAGSAVDETEDLPPDVRRELERQRLSQEEKRVAEAAAQYRAKVGGQGTGGASAVPSRASTIQKRVKSLLDEGRQSPVQGKRTAEGYGRYTDEPDTTQEQIPPPQQKPPVARKPVTNDIQSNNPYPKVRQQQQPIDPPQPPSPAIPAQPASAPPQQFPATAPSQQPQAAAARVVPRPSVPPKSQALRTGGSGKPQWPPPPAAAASSLSPPQEQPSAPPKPTSGLAALLAKDLEGVPDYPPPGSSGADVDARSAAVPARESRVEGLDGTKVEELEEEFGKRYPSLSGIDMVETEIGGLDQRRDERQGQGVGRSMREI